MKTTFFKRLLAFSFAVCMFLSFSIATSAFKGDADFVTQEESLAVQFEELLLNCASHEQRELILEKASNMGIVAADLANVSLSNADLALLDGSAKSQPSSLTNSRQPAIITGPASRVLVAGVDMPNYCLWPTIYKQTTSTYCSAATVYTAGKYIGANPPSQLTIMNFWKSQWNVTYPDLPLMRNYMNLHLPSRPTGYVPYVHRTASSYNNNQTTLNTDLKSNVLKYQPMILNMANNTTSTTYWPYKTAGHFCLCDGLLTWESNKYFIGDPYYFSTYVSGATANNGEHKRTWTQLKQVLTNKGQGYVT